MEALLLPLRTDEAQWYDFTTTLDGKNYRFELLWNEREEAWYLSLFDQLDAALMTGKKLVPDFPLLFRLADRRRPPGELTLVDTGGNNALPTFRDLGRRHVLMYLTNG